jgi:hypothetical protein
MWKIERYKLKQAAQDRLKELQDNFVRASLYRGHREWVIQYYIDAQMLDVD